MQMTECGSEVEQLILRLSTSLRMRNFAMCFEMGAGFCAQPYKDMFLISRLPSRTTSQ